ncbi:MAG: DUF3352 domain-containing protein [Cyanobacteria bacterium J06649_11]
MKRIISKESLFRLIAASCILLLLTAVAGCNRLNQNTLNTVSDSQKQPNPAVFVSKQAPVMVSMLLNSNRFETNTAGFGCF